MKRQWALMAEPTYRNLSGTTSTVDRGSSSREELIADLKFKSIELPLGIRYYLPLTPETRLFFNGSFGLDLDLPGSELLITRTNGEHVGALPFSGTSLALGAGVKYKSLGVELRYHLKRDIIKEYLFWHGDFQNVALVFGYSYLNKN